MELKDLTKAELITKINALNAQLAAGASAATDEVVAGLREEVSQLAQRCQVLNHELSASRDAERELQTVVRELNSRSIMDHSSADPGAPIVAHRGYTVRALRAVMWRGERFDPARIVRTPALLDFLIETKSSVIQIHPA